MRPRMTLHPPLLPPATEPVQRVSIDSLFLPAVTDPCADRANIFRRAKGITPHTGGASWSIKSNEIKKINSFSVF